MDPQLYPSEPFPTYIDAPPNPHTLPTRFQPLLAMQPLSRKTSVPSHRKHSLSERVSNTIRLRYYQYEVTFGLYMMTPTEKLVLNAIFLSIMALIGWGLYMGLNTFVVHSFCRWLYYMTGSLEARKELCNKIFMLEEGCSPNSVRCVVAEVANVTAEATTTLLRL